MGKKTSDFEKVGGRSRLEDRISIVDSKNSFQSQFLKALVRQRVLKVLNFAQVRHLRQSFVQI